MSADPRPVLRVASAEILHDGRYLLTRRPPHAVLPGLWEFPGGRVRDGEDAADALRRCLPKRIATEVEVGEHLLEISHGYDGYDVVLSVFRCRIVGDPPRPASVAEVAWVSPDRFGDYQFPDADQRTIDLLLQSDD
jgi:mutator protein MutT